MGVELGRVAAELELGASTDSALDALRARAACRSVDLLVAAIRLQRRSGGNLAALLRDVARSLEDRERLVAEARAETAQARFTAAIVIAMPVGLLGLGELAEPGLLARVTDAPAGVWLLGCAFLLQVAGALIVRRLVRPAA
jgi:tight adherence protein B